MMGGTYGAGKRGGIMGLTSGGGMGIGENIKRF